MGLLVEGIWHTDWYDTNSTGGRFVREASSFRNWVTRDGRAGPTGTGGFRAEPGRYHLYVSLACPWAHRTLIFRKLKGLEDMISISVVNAFIGNEGWTFAEGDEVIPDTVNHKTHLHQIYTLAQPDYTGRLTVPVLWDNKLEHIKQHYYRSHESINPTRIVPAGPIIDFMQPPGRKALAEQASA